MQITLKQSNKLELSQNMIDFLKKNPKHVIPAYIPIMLSSSKLRTIFNMKNDNEYYFDSTLIKTGNGQWNIIDDCALGAGSFGAVKTSSRKIVIDNNGRAKITQTDDAVKILKLPPSEKKQKKLLEDITREINALRENNIFASGPFIESDQMYIVMANCGTSLDKCMPKSEQFNFDTSFSMAMGLLNDMFALQGNECIHRDLKPANICRRTITTVSGKTFHQYIFIDFGLARKKNSKETDLSGTPVYMSPELFYGYATSHASDIYALAGIFLEIFGANPLRYKLQQSSHMGIALTSYSTKGLFNDYQTIPNDIDPPLLHDLKTLFIQMSDSDPKKRPTIEYIIKFFNGIPYRREIYKQIKNYNTQVTIINHLSKTIGITTNLTIHAMLDDHSIATQRILNEKSLLTNLYPDVLSFDELDYSKKALELVHAEYLIMVEKFTLSAGKMTGTNSSGIKKIQCLLANPKLTMLEKLQAMQSVGKEKTIDCFSNWIKRQSFFGKGRHQNVEQLYQTLANLNLPDTMTIKDTINCQLAKTLSDINQFIDVADTFVFRGH